MRIVCAATAAVFAYGLAVTQPWAHPAWTLASAERFLIAMALTAALTLVANKYWFYGAILVLACSTGLLPVVGLSFVLLGALNLGWLVFRNEDDRLNLLAGFVIYVWIFSLTASVPINTIWFWGVLLAIPIAIGRRVALPLPKPSVWIAMPLVANFLLALKPEVSADGLSMHLAIAQWVKDHARFHFDAANQIWSVQPMAGDWALSIANLFGGEIAARLLNFAWLLVIVSFVYRALRKRLEHAPAALITGIFAATPLLQLTSTSLFIENFWTALIVGALFAIEAGDMTLAAALAGGSGASKLLGLTPAPVLAAYAFFKGQPKWRAAFVFAAIAIVPYARAYWITGNPVFHYANAVFHSPLMPRVNFVDNRYPARLNWHTLYDVTFKTDLFVESEPGTAGYQWLWFLPLALLAIRKSSAMERAALATTVFMVVLVFSRQASLRYIEAAMPLLVIAFAPAAAALVKERWTMALAVALWMLNLHQMPASGGYQRDFALLPFSNAERVDYVTRIAPARPLIAEMNRRAPGAAVALFDGDEIAGLRGPALTSTWHTPRFADRLAAAHSVADYLKLLKDFRVEYVIAPREGHWRYISDSSMNVFLESSTERLAVSGTLQLVRLRADASPVELPPVGPGSYDDSNAHLVYMGGWYLDQSFAEPAHHTVSYTQDPLATVRLAFNGTKLTYTFTKAFNRGKAIVEIDGVIRQTIDEYSQEAQWQSQVVFDHLPGGPHTVVIRHGGPAGQFIDVDQLAVE